MNEQELLLDLTGIFQDIFDDENLQIRKESNAQNIRDWDSLNNINLIVAIEHNFNIKFKLEEVLNFKNVGDIISLISKKLNH